MFTFKYIPKAGTTCDAIPLLGANSMTHLQKKMAYVLPPQTKQAYQER